MKTNYLVILSLCLCFIMGSCGDSVKNDPVEITKAVIKCWKKGQFKGTEKFFMKDAKDVNYDDWQDTYDNPEGKNHGTVKRVQRLVEAEYTLTEQSIEGDRAIIEYSLKTSSLKSPFKFFLKKVDDKWYLETHN